MPSDSVHFVAEEGVWRRHDAGLDMTVDLDGDAAGPDAACLAEAQRRLAAMAESLACLETALPGRPVAVTEETSCCEVIHPESVVATPVQLEIRRNETGGLRVELFFVTDYPDPYHLYSAVLENGAPVEIRGSFW